LRTIIADALVRARLRPGGRLGWMRNALGAFVGIALTGLVTQALGKATGHAGVPWLAVPLGASAVLVFAVPASPLAQPWSVVGGNLLSATIGLAFGHALGVPWMAASVAVGAAIAVMTLARCLHPPGGACALLCALGAQTSGWGWDFLMLPLAINVGLLVLAGSLWNNATGHPWPHRPHPVPPLPAGTWAGTYESADLDVVLAEWDEVLDVDREDLDALFREVEQRVLRRWEASRR
jgi:CBS domain-containing membrane protein